MSNNYKPNNLKHHKKFYKKVVKCNTTINLSTFIKSIHTFQTLVYLNQDFIEIVY